MRERTVHPQTLLPLVASARSRPSLFVLSLPRSLSSIIYTVACAVLDLQQPQWTSDGEVLNSNRWGVLADHPEDPTKRYIQQHTDPVLFTQFTAFLHDVIHPEQFAYKDVVNPFVISHWLPCTSLRVLKIKRNLADIVYSLMARQWYYPAQAAAQHTERTDPLIEGLLRAERAIDRVPGVTIDYDAVIHSEQTLLDACTALYPGHSLGAFSFNDTFHRVRTVVLKRRETAGYNVITERVARQRLQGLVMSPDIHEDDACSQRKEVVH